MSKRLLFVDDEKMVLNGLCRALHGMRHQWDMNFVGSAPEALQALEQEGYDAVITDMRMPVMDGAQLLQRVKELYPGVVRIILSGQSSRDAVFRSIAPAHQFLSKPCDPCELVLRLGQALAMRDLLSNESLHTIVSNLQSIPSLPTLYEELTAALLLDTSSLPQIERIISRDVAMAAKILQLANSAFMGTRGRVSSLLQAVNLIGIESVRTLVLTVHIFSQSEANSKAAPYLQSLWDHSVTVASLAQRIATAEKCHKEIVEASFAAGLLHDIGKVIFLSEMRDKCLAILGSGVLLELERLGCTHAHLGAYLLSIWGLPASLVEAVAYHHAPSNAGEMQFCPLTAVHLADAIASAHDPCSLNRDIEIDINYLDTLGLRERVNTWQHLHEEQMAAKAGEKA